jgi:hypothetical protein
MTWQLTSSSICASKAGVTLQDLQSLIPPHGWLQAQPRGIQRYKRNFPGLISRHNARGSIT